MNNAEAKRILIGCRPGSADLRTDEAQQALALMEHDAELRQWWHEQQAFHLHARRAFHDAPVPADLKERLLAQHRVIRVNWWRHPALWSAAAAVIFLLVALSLWESHSREASFETFRSRMVRSVLRTYRMDITTNDMGQIRQFLARQLAPADYVLPPSLGQLTPMGAGVLSWQDRRVTMVCLDAGAQGTFFLFVVDQNAVRNPPLEQEFTPVSQLNTVSWTEGGRTYVLAGSAGREALERLL